VSFPAASTTSWSELNALYKENATASYQAIQQAYTNVALLSLPNSPDFIFPDAALDYSTGQPNTTNFFLSVCFRL
jgi:hypothetical protein